MSIALEILDAVTNKLEETSFGSATVERRILPETDKKGLEPTIIVTLQSKEIQKFDRSKEDILYGVGVGLHYPVDQTADSDLALAMAEDIQNWLSSTDNSILTIPSGCAAFKMPYEMEAVYDIQMLREANIFFTVTDFTYYVQRTRTT